ncbi:MAG: hypothetical protein JW795_18970 [Chitinivibrionales bacterium]|nr:hypothetical protein [Chitinivibrionales bacterium]
MTTPQLLDKIRTDIIVSGRDHRYTIQAYDFILAGLNFYHTKAGESRHFGGQELSLGFLEFAQKQYGPLAHMVLNSWGIYTTDDFGSIIFNLIEIKLIKKNENDSIDDFKNIVDMTTFFQKQDPFTINKSFIKAIKGA